MKLSRKIIIGLIFLYIIAWTLGIFDGLIYASYSPFKLYKIDQKFNSLQVLNRNCLSDLDCVMRQIDCTPCAGKSEGAAVNRNYRPLCPLKTLLIGGTFCPDVMPRWALLFDARCENNVCVETKHEPPH